MKNTVKVLFYSLPFILLSEVCFSMENNFDEGKKDPKTRVLLRPYQPNFSIGSISEKYSENDMIGYNKKHTEVKRNFFIRNVLFLLKKVFKK